MIKLIAVAMILLATFSFTGSATTEIRPTLTLDYSIEPGVFMPGDVGTIAVTLSNMATGEIYVKEDDETLDMNAYIASASLNGNSELEILDTSYTDIGLLGPGDSLKLTFNVKVLDNATTGVHFVDLTIVGGSNMYDLNYRIPIKVDDRNVKVIMSNFPSTLMNEVSTISVDVVNRRPNDVTSVIVTPYAEGMTFSPSDYFVGSIPKGNKSTATFTFNTMSSEEGNTEVTFTSSYFNGDNLHYSNTASKEVRIIKQSPLVFTGIEIESSGNKYTLSGDLNNFGITDAKNVMVSIEDTEGIEPLQPYANYFIGTLEADDFSSFELSARVTSQNVTSIPIIIEFRDPDNAYTAITQEISLDTTSGVSYSSNNDEGSSLGLWLGASIIVIAILVVIGYSWKKRKDDENEDDQGADEEDELPDDVYVDEEDDEIIE
ncbi:hypothetical protein SAMN04488589_1139 [Methanolobus vulcani]|uniref:S-layer domain-containing protein n=1 Tax=Methanolobus vulcani TaxID=38026 RepID=A0A7Z7FDZ2_9EURY|nr:hypothetical protein [Methanolobus vulcani]SDF69277.1 hypothetical protein SAMN04488589_1139 [Methanolobus vulcani]